MKLVYIAGAFRAPTPWLVEQNIRLAEDYMMRVWKMGAVGVCPHTMCRFSDKELPDALVLQGTVDLLKRCDAVLMVEENWKMSSGAINERLVALAAKIPVFLSIVELQEWVKANA